MPSVPPLSSSSPSLSLDPSSFYDHRAISVAVDPLPAPRNITVGVAKWCFRREFDPNKTVSIFSTVSAHSSPTSSSYALDHSVCRLIRRHVLPLKVSEDRGMELLFLSDFPNYSTLDLLDFSDRPGCASVVPSETFSLLIKFLLRMSLPFYLG